MKHFSWLCILFLVCRMFQSKKRRFCSWNLFLPVFLMVSLASCTNSGNTNNPSDIDAPSDISKENEESRCQEGFVYRNGKCVPDGNPDEDQPVTETDKDPDLDPDEKEIEPGETPFSHLSFCPSNDGPFPCISNLPFEYTNDKGEFRFGSPAGAFQDGRDVWENWIAFYWNRNDGEEKNGLFLFDYLTKTFIILTHYSIFFDINENRIVWLDPHQDSTSGTPKKSIFQSSLIYIEKKRISNTSTDKIRPKIAGEKTYWNDYREFGNEYNYNIYTLNNSNEEVKVDSIGNLGVDRYAVHGNKVAYAVKPYYSLALIDYDKEYEKVISEDAAAKFKIVMSDKYIFWNSLRYAENTDCGYSILKYDLETGEETIFKQSTGLDDWLVWDIWEDWLVYTDYSKGGGVIEEADKCRYVGADGDLILHYLPTGEEWNLTDEHGSQEQAAMWGPLIVWKDSRHDVSPPWGVSNVFGVDLCMHPELKSRFEACAKR